MKLSILVLSALMLSGSFANAAAVAIDRAPAPQIPPPVVIPDPGNGGGGGGGGCTSNCGPITITTPGGSSGFDGNGLAGVVIKKHRSDFRLECTLDVASADDLILINAGSTTLHAGSKIAFQVMPANTRGYMTLNVDLPANGKARAADLVAGSAANTACAAQVIEDSTDSAAVAQ